MGKLESETKTAVPKEFPSGAFISHLIPIVKPCGPDTSSSGVINPSSSESIQEFFEVEINIFLFHSNP